MTDGILDKIIIIAIKKCIWVILKRDGKATFPIENVDITTFSKTKSLF
jgi:hypothetical protein